MKNKHKAMFALLLLIGLIFILFINANNRLKAEHQELAKAVFKVA